MAFLQINEFRAGHQVYNKKEQLKSAIIIVYKVTKLKKNKKQFTCIIKIKHYNNIIHNKQGFIRIHFICNKEKVFYNQITFKNTKNPFISQNKMPRRQTLAAIVPNRFYQIDATLKYQHVGQNSITGIIEQNNVQSKILLPKDGIQLEEGKKYVFGKCFNSRNGWLYARNPSQTIIQKRSSNQERMSEQEPAQNNSNELISLKNVYQQKQKLMNHYISTQLMIVSIEPKKTITQRNGELLILYKMKCWSENLMIDIEIWNQEIKQEQVKGKILNFIGFRIKNLTHQTISFVSTVYSRIQEPDQVFVNGYFENILYRNVSSVYDIRTIEQTHKVCEMIHKNYTLCMASINNIEEFTYEGCEKCKKKTGQNGCFQCGVNIRKVNYNYLRVVIEDETGMMECAIFDQQYLEIANKLKENGKAIFKIKSSTKRNHETNQLYASHVITQIKEFAINA